MKKRIFIAAAVIFSSHVQAQIFKQKPASADSVIVIPDDFPYPSKVLDKVEVTSNKFPEKQSRTGKVTTIIDKETLERMSGNSVGEILNTVAGVTVNGANNNLGTNQRISIRGSSDGNVLLLVDGIPQNDPSVISNYFDLNFINASQIERIEILKGAQSTLYGSDAVSGVINIITKKNETKKFVPYASASFGSYGTVNGAAGIRGQTKIFTYNAYASAINSTGFSAAYDSTGNKKFHKDGYNQYVLRGDIGVKISKGLTCNFYGNFTRYKADVDAAAFTDDKDFIIKNKNWQAGSGIQWKKNKSDLHLSYQYNYINRFYLDDSTDRGSFSYFSQSNYTGRTHFAELYENYKWSNISILTGVDYRFYNTQQVYNSVSSFGPFNTLLTDSLAKMWQLSPYVSLVYSFNNTNVELGGRYNHHSIYGDNFTYTFNPSYLIQQKIKLFANVASAFKTPSLFQLFDAYSGNENLSPEKTVITEAGIEIYPADVIRLKLTGFYRKTKNAIQYIITDPNFFTGHYENITDQRNYGAETEFDYTGEKWNINANYTFTKGKIKSAYSESGDKLANDTSYNNLYRVPENAVNIFASYHLNKKIILSSLLKYVGKRLEPVYASAPKQLNDYFTIDLSGQYRFAESVSMFIDLKNITNQKYFDVLGYNSRRFNVNGGVQIGL
jgi:vitamin B12 transporter